MQRHSIWITGCEGRLGSTLMAHFSNKTNYKIIGTDTETDITDIENVAHHIDAYRPGTIINCASYSDAEKCEENPIEAYRVNALGARNLASQSRRINARIIHLSTDDVFSGEHNRPKDEFDEPTPNTVYGKSKFAGEKFVRELNPKHLIVRSSWLYGTGSHSYYDKVLEKARNGEKIKAPIDVFGTPTCADDLIPFFVKILESDEYGIFHVSSQGACTRYDYARRVLWLNGFDPNMVEEGFAEEEGAVVSTVLENLMLTLTGIYEMPNWREAMERYAKKNKKGE